MRKFIGKMLAWVGGITIVAFVLIFVIATFARASKGKVPGKVVLEMNLESGLMEDAPEDPLAKLTGREEPTLRDVVDALEKAQTDDRVQGVVARVGAAPMNMGQVQEIRDAVAAFRSKKKFAIAYGETFGEFGPGNSSYYLATAFDEIWLQPSGDVGFNGLLMESMFVRGTLDKLGMIPRMDQRYEYKNAMNFYTDKKFTAPYREAMEKLRDAYFGQIVRGVAERRKLTQDEVKAAADRGPLLGKEAVDAKLVDGLAYRDEVYANVRKKAGNGAQFLFLSKYLDRAGRPHQKGPVVALIFGVGGVQRGRSSFDPIQGSQTMGSETVAGAFRAAIRDRDVKAILFRVDSPGGSYVASDTIWRETIRAKKAGKPVIVSMGGVAASGGYFVSMAADKIVAQPGTITGSIGVLAGKMLTNGLWDKVGVSWDEVHVGQNSRMFSSTSDYSKEEWEKFQAWLDRIYSDFTSKVAEGRKLPKGRVLEIAKGRVWSGEDAKAIGLVDVLGGYPAAMKLVKEAVKADDDVTIRVYPKKKGALEALVARFAEAEGESSESEGEAREEREGKVLAQILETVRPVAQALKAAGVGAQPDVLALPSVPVMK